MLKNILMYVMYVDVKHWIDFASSVGNWKWNHYIYIHVILIYVFVMSYRRKLKADISTAFPLLSEEDLNELVPNKEELNIVKIYAHKGEATTLYVLHKNPIFFQLEKQLFPTGGSATLISIFI